ncbi:hypothetical protein ACSBR2_015796 [Camellia fascicularis]
MKPLSIQSMAIILLVYASLGVTKSHAKKVTPQHVTCQNRGSKCFLKYVAYPVECPKVQPAETDARGCFFDCYSPKCEARKPNCNGSGAACFDPWFIGGDGIVFYFHGKSNEHFSLVSDLNLQINARFIGLRPSGRTCDYTWIQALGLIEDFKQEQCHCHCAEIVEALVSVVPVSEEENQIHNYWIPCDDSFAHLEVQFRFMGLSNEVDGVLDQTHRPDFKNLAKAGVAMAVIGGEDRESSMGLEYSGGNTIDCTRGSGGGNGIVCRK